MPPRPPTLKARQSASAAKSSRHDLHFLALPLEIRENIFSYLVDEDPPETLLDLIVVNHQLSDEVTPFLFRRPLYFEGQAKLFRWLTTIDHDNLRYVADLTFQLHDIMPREIIGALGDRLRQTERAGENPYHKACELEVRKIGHAFSLMPNVRSLSIIPCTEADPRPSHRMLIQFSKMLSRCFPNLDTLLSKEKALPINFATNKPRLRRLQIPSSCSSSCAEMATVFSAVPATRLAIYGCDYPVTPSSPATGMVADVLRAIRPLRELTLYEADINLLARDVAHDLLVKSPDALGKHLPTLRTLKVLVEYSSDVPRASLTMAQLQKFLHVSEVQRLEMAEPLIFTLDHRLPASLVTYVIRLDRPCQDDTDLADRLECLLDQFENLADHLKRSEGSVLPNLREIIILVEDDEDNDEIEELEEYEQAQSFFEDTQVEVKWMPAHQHASL